MSRTAAVAQIAQALESAGLLVERRGVLPERLAGITEDSRAVTPGGAFVAVRGTQRDGHAYLGAAEQAGAALAILEDALASTLPALVVRDGRRAAAVAASAYYGEPASFLRFVGVTGTNGKTTTVGMLRHLLDAPSARSASIGTLGVLIGSAGEPFPGGGGLTTPGAIELQRLLRALVDAGVKSVAMEASSHALHQGRIEGLRFAAAVFTNLTRDHLDYHGTFEAYLAAKAMLADYVLPDGTLVINADDSAWNALPPAPAHLTFGIESADAQVRAEQVSFHPRGSRWTLARGDERADVALPLIGDFNVANALGAAAAAIAVGIDLRTVAERLGTLPQVPGRLEILSERPTVLRDYAHTPDALDRALRALRPFTPGRLIALFGCGGDRDKGKRPMMADVAHRLADAVVVTSDNPRTEDPERILDDICVALPPGSYERIEDRRTAIAAAIAMADPARDVVLLAGKGHETYQIRGTTSYPFDEAAIVRGLLGTE
ncbi:MAG: UDP-N-acetylmuramoyl-L-alanyl-D-glutamate--2,6-diaminopimelate ligase [Gemmatimonadetes bacterium]|nr:UDP-N-acetylmuramoyl-L-alanyl-D-glutamate--2,6-diaminopimelate ligase [Gemmatimonadota bacterium]